MTTKLGNLTQRNPIFYEVIDISFESKGNSLKIE